MAYQRNALSLLLEYDSDSDRDSGYTSEEERKRKANFFNPRERKKKAAKIFNDEISMDYNESEVTHNFSNNTTRDISDDQCNKPIIPLPSEFVQQIPEVLDDPSLHQGRIRSFPHERGNWASLIYIPLSLGIYEPHLKSMISSLIAACQENKLVLNSSSEFHISLSRTLNLRLHWIEPLVQDIKKRLSRFPKFYVYMDGLGIYCNEQCTRTFLGLKVNHGKQYMMQIVSTLNESLVEYRFPTFYEDCSFHVSLAWCNGNKKDELSKILSQLEGICLHYFKLENDIQKFQVDELYFKTGNRIHKIPLMNNS